MLLGLGGGALVGLAIYAGLTRIPTRHVFGVTNVLIALLAGSIASQLARALAQAGFIEAGTSPLWDSSWLLAQDSTLGALMHGLVGYDAHPTGAQLASYLGGAAADLCRNPVAGGKTARRRLNDNDFIVAGTGAAAAAAANQAARSVGRQTPRNHHAASRSGVDPIR